MPIDLTDGIVGWILLGTISGGIASGMMSLLGNKYWTLVMRFATLVIVLVYVLMWTHSALLLSDIPPNRSLLASISKVAELKIAMIEYISRNEHWTRLVRQWLWELAPLIQLSIVCFHYVLRRRAQQRE
jgi:hypothetical protein